ncbi:hypothetical protein ACOKGD_04880 [Microbacterium phosphatis]|uniref:hypothetical protein n=1 Tax=Microbacterium phosphatis TaxID=3140248 RepID=UPI0031407124
MATLRMDHVSVVVEDLPGAMFEVDDVRDTVERLRAHGGELIGEVTPFEDQYVLCYLRGPAGIIVALAESVAPAS